MSSRYTYAWSKGYAVNAQIVGEWIEALNDKSPSGIVAAAESMNSPVHDLFEWDDSKAAARYRLTQAAVMRKSLTVEIINEKKEPTFVVAFIAAENRGQVVPILEASAQELTDEENRCLSMMRRFKNRYSGLNIARNVIVAIDEVQQTHARRRKRKAAKR